MGKKLAPVHPGEVLREEFLEPMKLTPYSVAAKLGVPRTRIERLAGEQTPVTADTALLPPPSQDRTALGYSSRTRAHNKGCIANHIGGRFSPLGFRHCRSRSPLSKAIDQMAAGSHGRGSDLLARQALGARRI